MTTSPYRVRLAEQEIADGIAELVGVVETADGRGRCAVLVDHGNAVLRAIAPAGALSAHAARQTRRCIDGALEAHRIDCEMNQGWPYRECLPPEGDA